MTDLIDEISVNELLERLNGAETILETLRSEQMDRLCSGDDPLIKRFKSLLEKERFATQCRAVFESMKDAICIVDSEQRIVLVNKTAEKIFKKSASEMQGRPCWEVVHGIDKPISQCPFEQVKKSLQRKKIELSLGANWFEIRMDPIIDESGQFSGAVHILSDITERKQAEMTVRETEDLFTKIFRSSPVGINIFRISDNRSFVANDAFLALVGYSKDEVQGHTAAELDLFVNGGLHRIWLNILKSTGYVYNQMARIRTKSGEIKDTIASLQMVEIKGEPMVMVIMTNITEQRRSEEALRESEKRFRHVFESANVGKSITLPTGELYVNKAFAAMLGYHRDELAYKTWQDITPLEEIESTQKIVGQLLSGERDSVRFTKRYTHKNGSHIWTDVSVAIRRDETGSPLHFITTIVDITERKRAEEELRLSQKRFSNAFMVSPAGMAISRSSDAKIIDVNESFLKIFEFRREEVIDHTSLELNMFTPKEWDKLMQLHFKSGGLKNFEVKARSKSGTPLTLLLSSRPFESADEMCHITIIIDISDRKKAEAERERLMMAIEQTGESVTITDPNGVIEYANKAFENLSGYLREEVYGTPFISKGALQDETVYRHLWQTIRSGATWQGRLMNKRKDGTLLTEEATISPVKDDLDRVVSYVVVKRDITEQLRASEEKTLLQEQLQQAQKLESVGHLAGGVAHDFNNMLGIILGYGENILDELHDDDPLREEVKEIVAAGKRSASLTRQLLAFSRRQPLQPKVLNLNRVIVNMEKMLRRLIGEDIAPKLSLSDNLGPVMADPGQIEQVIMNLAVNARDAMPKGGSLLIETGNVEFDEKYLRSHAIVAPGKYVLLAMSDTGCGMEKKLIAKIFDPFFTTKAKGKGSGLGLSMVYGIVKQSGGDIFVYSEPGHGTTFKLYFPRTDTIEALDKPEAEEKSRRGGGRHILIVEDEPGLRKLIAAILGRLDYRVTMAGNGGEALLLVEELENKPDLILTDVIMPNMSGKELVDRLRKTLPEVKVIFMSGYTDDAIAHHEVLGPGIPFIQKPFSSRDISEKIRSVLWAEGK